MEPLQPTFELVTQAQSGAIEQQEAAQIDRQIATAKRYPRDPVAVRNEMMSAATVDQATAEKVFYKLPRGGKSIEGPSIRMAEIAISAWGNIRVQNRTVETVTSGDHPFVMVRAEVFDLQKNVAVAIEKRRRITGKKKWVDGLQVGNQPPDDDDINLATNACGAVAIRDAVFKVIPLAFIRPVFEAAKKIAVGTAATLADRRAKCIESFAKMGVQQDKILALLEKKSIQDIDLDDLATLIGVFTAIKDGEQSIDEAFPAAKPTSAQSPSIPSVLSHPTAPNTGSSAPSTETVTAPRPTPEMAPAAPAASITQESAKASDDETAAALEPKKGVANSDDPVGAIAKLMAQDGVSMEQLMAWAKANKFAKAEQKTIDQLSSGKMRNIIAHWGEKLAEIKTVPQQ